MILLIDNYDSFSYNLVQLIGTICEEKKKEPGTDSSLYEIKVIRNDEMTVEEINGLNPEYVILSPGPKRPSEAGICEELVKKADGSYKILGVCLGHQGICEALGGKIVYAKELMHGKQSVVKHTDSKIYEGIPENFKVARYHSLAVEEKSLPKELRVTARTEDGEIMSVEHTKYPIYGLQYHPESVLTPEGRKIIENFLNI